MQACTSSLRENGRLSSNWSTCRTETLQAEPSAAADNVQFRCRRSALQPNRRLRKAASPCASQAIAANHSIVRRRQQAAQEFGLNTGNLFVQQNQLGASHIRAPGKRQASVCRSSLHQVAPLYEIAAGGETINPWSLIALAVGTAALAYLSGLVMGKQLEDEAEEMETKLSEQGENGEPEPSPEPVRKRNRPIRREP